MTATRPALETIEGTFIRMEPLTASELPELHAAIGHPEVFAGGYGGGPAGYRETLDGFIPWAESYYQWGEGNAYVIRARGGELDGVLIGTSTLGDFDEPREHAHIGWTAYDPRVWGTQVNAEAKLILLGLAFDAGFGRVKIQADSVNDRSRAAILKLGAQFEGIIRRDMLRADGSWRSSAIYSILGDEWPGIRAGLEARLDVYGSDPVRPRDAAGSAGSARPRD